MFHLLLVLIRRTKPCFVQARPRYGRSMASSYGFIILLLCCIVFAGCRPSTTPPAITLATTTSPRDSGLLDALLPGFTAQTGVQVKVVAVGSGQALELARRGDADVLLTHSPAAEEQFMAAGHGSARHAVMHNDFVVVGPAEDPANIASATTAATAFQRLAQAQAPFISRADESGTHKKEQQIWQAAATEPSGAWYIKSGSGMAAALRMANEKHAYTLTDRGTFLAHRKQLDLKILYAGDPLLVNAYSVIVVATNRQPHTQHAQAFAEFLISPPTQAKIAAFGVAEHGQSLFLPDAVP